MYNISMKNPKAGWKYADGQISSLIRLARNERSHYEKPNPRQPIRATRSVVIISLKQVLRRICRWWELNPSDWNTFQEWYAWFSSIRFSSKSKSLLEGTFFVAWWNIWRIRNRIIFEGVLPKRSEVLDNIIFCAFNWCNNRCRKVFSWEDWLKNPHHISL
nr:RNA-directed DNA polymerase, eukaryota [Tanacetum cinerariifolium]